MIGSSIGEKNEKNVLSYFGNVIIYSIIISVVVSILGFAFGEKIFLLMNSSQEVTILGLEYINVIFLGTILFILVVALNSFLHAEGDTKTYRNVLIFSFFLKNIFFQSMPITIAILGYSIAATVVFTYVGLFGEYAVAGYGSATRIEQVVLLPILGINTAIISIICLLYTSPSPRDLSTSRMPSSA